LLVSGPDATRADLLELAHRLAVRSFHRHLGGLGDRFRAMDSEWLTRPSAAEAVLADGREITIDD
jgi:hypothetical protein